MEQDDEAPGRWRRRDLLAAAATLPFATAGSRGALARAAAPVWPGPAGWRSATPAQVGVDPAKLGQGVRYAQDFGGSGMVVRSGHRIASWGSPATRYNLYSATKSFGSILLGLAVGDGKLGLGDRVLPRLRELGVPPESNRATGWLPRITVEQLATHTAGFENTGGFGALLYEPGTAWLYSNGGANWLADLVTVSYGQDLREVLRGRVLRPLGIPTNALIWGGAAKSRPKTFRGLTRRDFKSGISTNVDAMARIGLLMARGGTWETTRILPADYVAAAGATPSALKGVPLLDPAEWPTAPERYGLLWWNNANGVIAGLPRDAFWAWGLNDALILVVPSLDLVASRAGPRMDSGRFAGTPALLRPARAGRAAALDRRSRPSRDTLERTFRHWPEEKGRGFRRGPVGRKRLKSGVTGNTHEHEGILARTPTLGKCHIAR